MWKDKQDSRRMDDNDLDAAGAALDTPRPESNQDVSAFVGKGVVFKGMISYNGTVRIDGTLEGELHTDGVLLVGEEAVLNAKVTAGTIVCKGKITGDITAREKMKLRAPAVINGGVTTPMLSMEEGVLFNGTLEMEQQARPVHKEPPLHALGTGNEPPVRRLTSS
ncbi:MAG TPA: polymer-forming cytoskeletal protein [Nitrospira sp.]|nr:polymer-forming cytoskeletal protein [Nitrospira sp.]